MRWAGNPRGDEGAGSILGIAILTGMVCVASALLPLVAVLQARERVSGAADAAALAAAQVAIGLLPGFPCTTAERVAAANGATIDACAVDGDVVTVRATGTVLGFGVAVDATAGPPPSGGD